MYTLYITVYNILKKQQHISYLDFLLLYFLITKTSLIRK